MMNKNIFIQELKITGGNEKYNPQITQLKITGGNSTNKNFVHELHELHE